MLRYLIVVAGFVWKFTSSSIVQPYIVGGETARPLEFPYLAVGTSGKLCGGSLIWPDVRVIMEAEETESKGLFHCSISLKTAAHLLVHYTFSYSDCSYCGSLPTRFSNRRNYRVS